jgi:hypothetical protein
MKKKIIFILFLFLSSIVVSSQEKGEVTYKKRRNSIIKKEVVTTLDTTFKEKKMVKKTKTQIVDINESTTNSKIIPSKKHKGGSPKIKSNPPRTVKTKRRRVDPAPCRSFSGKNKWMTDRYAHKKSKYLK